MARTPLAAFFNRPHPVMEKHMPDEAQMQDKINWVAAHLKPVPR
jgi:hypothetical protein